MAHQYVPDFDGFPQAPVNAHEIGNNNRLRFSLMKAAGGGPGRVEVLIGLPELIGDQVNHAGLGLHLAADTE